jgi:hypothetical protein
MGDFDLECNLSEIYYNDSFFNQTVYRVYWYNSEFEVLPKLYYTEYIPEIDKYGIYWLKFNFLFSLPNINKLNENNNIIFIGIKKVINYNIINVEDDTEFEYFGTNLEYLIESSELINEKGELIEIINIKPAKR